MSEHCNHCAETDEKLQAAEKRIKELEAVATAAKEFVNWLDGHGAASDILTKIEGLMQAVKSFGKADQISRLGKKVDPDPWLGVWQHKENGKKIEVIEGIQTIQLVKWGRSSGIEASMDINFLLANFEKVTEEGEG